MSTNLHTFFQDLQWRGIIANSANLENFYQLKPEEKVIYLGIDCTGESLHIGHLFLYLQAVRFAQAGFQILLVLGGATSKIGDPSDKLKERPLLEASQIEDYQKKIKSQLERILIRPKKIEEVNFAPLELFFSDNQELLKNIYNILEIKKEDRTEKKWEKYLEYIWPLKENKFRILNNDDWLGKLTLIDFNKIGQNISVNYLLSKETIKQRVNSETGLSFLAFSYSLLQAYDFYYLYENYKCHGQLGGSDQWGNLTTGLKLIRSFYPENKTFVFTLNLLTDKGGKKFSKSGSSENILWLNSAKKDFFNFFSNMTDEQVKVYIKQFTFLRERQIEELIKLNAKSPKLRILQRVLYELIYWLNYGGVKEIIYKIKLMMTEYQSK
ncbi:MAG: tyrosine--tRNA ligase [Candidatus Moeniiplasma glomeromycotorum]|nr:tyrosine--tRNA ligase [Candidatus Moeniiplasma glomeromycotorum]